MLTLVAVVLAREPAMLCACRPDAIELWSSVWLSRNATSETRLENAISLFKQTDSTISLNSYHRAMDRIYPYEQSDMHRLVVKKKTKTLFVRILWILRFINGGQLIGPRAR